MKSRIDSSRMINIVGLNKSKFRRFSRPIPSDMHIEYRISAQFAQTGSPAPNAFIPKCTNTPLSQYYPAYAIVTLLSTANLS